MPKARKGFVDVISSAPEKIKDRASAIVAPLTTRERLVYSVLALSFISLIVAPRIVADVGDEGSEFAVAATQCASTDSWLFPEHVTGQPELVPGSGRADITADNAAIWTGAAGAFTCSGYSPILEHNQINNGVRVILKASNESADSFISEGATDNQATSAAIQDGAVLNERIDGRPSLIEPNNFGEQSTVGIDTVLLLSVSDDSGETWTPLHGFGSEITSSTESVYDIALPPQFTSESSNLQFRIEAVLDDETVTYFVESLMWTYEVGIQSELSSSLIDPDTGEKIVDELPVLTQGDDVVVEIGIKDPNDGLWQGLRTRATSAVGDVDVPEITVEAKLLNDEGVVIESTTTTAEYTGTDLSNTDTWETPVDILPTTADPGVYTLQLDITDTDGGVNTITQDFLWGVLALNTDRDSYLIDETAAIAISVVDQVGASVCDADLSLTIESPSGGSTVTTNNGITLGPKCEIYGNHIDADYAAEYQFIETGTHTLSLTATTENGQFTITESIEVVDAAPIRLQRSGPTRIYPLVPYPVTISAYAENGFVGIVQETVPLGFEIDQLDFAAPYDSVAIVGGDQIITWNVNIPAGETVSLGYSFDAPDIAPEFYLLGPAQLIDPSSTVAYTEQRQWQVAGDAVDLIRVTTYELQTGEFTGTTYTLTLNNDLENDYFPVIVGPTSATGNRGPNQESVRVTGDPWSNFGTSTSANQIELSRNTASNSWNGTVTIVECLLQCSTTGFSLSEVLETSLAAGTANAQQTVTDTLASPHTANTVPIGGVRGGGLTSTATSNNDYSTTIAAKISKVGSDQIQFDRYGGENRTPAAATYTTYIVEWGSEWTVQNANVTGTNAGSGLTLTSQWDTAAITSVNRANTFVIGSGFTRDDGLGDGALGQVITLGNGVATNASETLVAVGGEGALIAPGRDFEVYTMTHPTLAVDYEFRARGDQGAGSGFQELDITIDAALSDETYDNASATVQYTEGYRLPLFTSTSGGTGQAYSRTGAWGTRIDADTNLNYFRGYAGQPVTGWVQVADFGNFTFSNVDTRQDGFRWRDDSADLDTSSGWLAAEDTNPAAQDKLTDLRLRLRVENDGLTPEEAARTYELQFAALFGFSDCTQPTSWTGIEDSATDEFEMYTSANIDPDGESTSVSHLSADGFTYLNGEARELVDTTGNIGPMSANVYTELEYTIRPTTETVNGRTYCFRLFDTTAASTLDGYDNFPQLTISSTAIVQDDGLGEVGLVTAPADGAFTTVTFDKSYTNPVVVGVTQEQNTQNALEFEVDNVTSTSADIRLCESEGSSANGCDTHPAATAAYMVIDAAVAATTPGIEAGTATLSGGENGATNIAYPSAFSTTPYVFANVNTVNSTEFPISVVLRNVTTTQFNANICDHLLGSVDGCDTTHGSETVGWIAIEPGNEPFSELFDNNSQSIDTDGGTWVGVSFAQAFSSTPAVLLASQTDAGAQDVEIEGVNAVTTTGADIRFCEIDSLDTCDTHAADTVAWHAMETGVIDDTIQLDQDGFRFYENVNAVQPTTPLGDEDTAIANVEDGDILRLRMALQNGDVQIVQSDAIDFTLEYAEATDCSAVVSWNDVGGIGSGTIWRGFNNAGPADEATITTSLLDAGGNTLLSYEEENDSATNPNQINQGGRGEIDWVIENNGATDFTSYCFRMVSSSDDEFQYSVYPRLNTSSGEAPLDPNSPASLGQEKTGGDPITIGDVINESTVVFTAGVSDGNTSDILELCVEAVPLGTAFTNTETACGDPVTYTGTALAADVEISGLSNYTAYHWQARVRDAAGAFSSWVSFGGNAETDTDFSIDTVAATVAVFDGTTTGVDVDLNTGELDELSANWDVTEGIQPDSLSSLVLWLDGGDVDGTGTDPSDGSAITTWTDKSGNGNDIAGTGAATFDATEQAVAFSDTARPFDDNYDRTGGNANSQTIFAVVQGNGTTSNHVWYETTTPRVAPAENGLLGGGTSLTGNNLWSSHITDTKLMTLEYLSTGTSTAWLDRTQEYQFSETQNFANSQRLVIGDDTTGGNQLEAGEFVHEILVYNEDLSTAEREDIWRYLECKWNLVDCSVTYERSVGTSPGGTDILNWTSSGTSTSATETALNLNTNQPYYFNIRATDAAGNISTTTSDGIFVAPTLSFAISATSLDLGNVNQGNNLTTTDTTTLTTSTNAYNGYEIRAYATGLLTNGSDTIPMFNGGTYISTDEWLAGDIGYGYTSSDTTIQGVNKFNGSPCAGGGNAPCYAPWSLTAPGDIIADNDSLVSGTAISNEQFTITHRVTTSATQATGDYTTNIIYVITARY